MVKIVAVVPSYEEELQIGETVRSLFSIDEVDRVMVIDDGSTDHTAKSASNAGAVIVANSPNLGKGKSLNRVLPHIDFDILLLIDGDLGSSAKEASALLAPVLKGEAELAIAAFPSPEVKGGFGLAQGVARRGIRRATGREMASPLSGQRALTREVYDATSPLPCGFGVEVGMTVDAINKGYQVVEVNTRMSHKETGRDIAGFVHRGRQFADIVKVFAKRWHPRGR